MKKILALLLIMSLIITGNTVKAEEPEVIVYDYDNYQVKYLINSKWDNGKSVNVMFTNTSEEAIKNWGLKFDEKGKFSSIWNAEVYDELEDGFIVKDAGWNYSIEPNESIQFGYILEEYEDSAPESFSIIFADKKLQDHVITDLEIINRWESGFEGKIVINNCSDTALVGWELMIDTNFSVKSIWGGEINSKTENNYVISALNYSNHIEPNGNQEIGFIADIDSNQEVVFENCQIYSQKMQLKEEIKKCEMELYASEYEICTDKESESVYVYASSNVVVDKIELIDKYSGEIVGEMIDDGEYSISGDDMKGDGVYSCIIDIDTLSEKEYVLYSRNMQYVEGVSNEIKISVIDKLNSKELDEMHEVDNVINNLISSKEYRESTLIDKKEQVQKLLEEISQNSVEKDEVGLIVMESINFDEDTNMFSFTYKCGVLGGVLLEEFSDEYNGEFEYNNQEVINTVKYKVDSMSDELPDGMVNAMILYAFDDTENSERYPNYVAYESEWEELGMNTTIDIDVTVDDFKNNLSDNSIIVFSMHGTTYSYRHGFLWLKKTVLPALCTLEKSTKEKDEAYSIELKNKRIVKTFSLQHGAVYFILPSLFTETYNDKKLDNSCVFMENCEGFGKKGDEDYTLADALKQSGAKSVIGFHNSVFAVYSRDIMNSFVIQMVNGSKVSEALDICAETFGTDDLVWAKNEEIDVPNGKETAYPIIYGAKESMLYHYGVQNGNFEEGILSISNKLILGWGQSGDARVVTKLGDILPIRGNNMSIITTGIGSLEDEYIEENEESSIYQQFYIPEGSNKLSFYYNVISEEPMEYVETEFDDYFYISLLDVNDDKKLDEKLESVNLSQWYKIENVDFDGGDETVYKTGWKKVEIDVSECHNVFVTLKFSIADVGDSDYDTVALIDCVSID